MNGLPEEIGKNLQNCAKDIGNIIDKYFPEVRKAWNQRDPNSFDDRIRMTMYLELIHAGYFDK